MKEAKKKRRRHEPDERLEYRMNCRNMGLKGVCYNHSKFVGPVHTTEYCNGICMRMKLWDTQHGYKGIEFKPREI